MCSVGLSVICHRQHNRVPTFHPAISMANKHRLSPTCSLSMRMFHGEKLVHLEESASGSPSSCPSVERGERLFKLFIFTQQTNEILSIVSGGSHQNDFRNVCGKYSTLLPHRLTQAVAQRPNLSRRRSTVNRVFEHAALLFTGAAVTGTSRGSQPFLN